VQGSVNVKRGVGVSTYDFMISW